MEQQFLRVFNRIIELWCSPKIDDYFTDLLIDGRGGRQGFPLEVVSELFVLSHFNAKLRSQEQQLIAASNPWDNVEYSKRTAIVQPGYELFPKGFLQSAEKGNLNAVALFVSSGINIDTRDARGWTPLIASSFHGNEDIALLLICNFADIHAKNQGAMARCTGPHLTATAMR